MQKTEITGIPFKETDRVRDMIRRDANLLPVLSRFGIAPGFGNDTAAKVCRANSVHTATFLAVANFTGNLPADTSDISLRSLIEYLKSAHSYFLEYRLPMLRRQLVEALADAGNDDITLMVLRFYDQYVASVHAHMEYENTHVFTYVQSLLANEPPTGEFRIAHFKDNHAPISDKLADLKEIFITHYSAPGSSSERVNSALYMLILCEHDLMTHCAVEDKILVPAVAALEKKMSKTASGTDTHVAETAADKASADPDLLTEREKEIVRCVARGLSNKEIAQRLFLSVHTVTTHRRNISAKLAIHSPAGLAIYAIIHKLLDLSEVKAQ